MIRKFNEALGYGRVSNVVGYAIDPDKLPPPMPGAEWTEDKSFKEADALLVDPELKRVFDVVRRNGATTVTRVV